MTGPYEATAGNPRNGQIHHSPGLWRTPDRDYAIVIRADWHPVLWWRDRDDDSTWQSRDMTDEFGLINATNSHMAMALGVTWDGRAVLAGNTHHDPIKWWWSAPGDPSTGWAEVPRPAAWAAWSVLATYQAMVRLSDGTLLMLTDHSPAPVVGRSWSVLRLPAGTSEWIAAGDANGNVMVAPTEGTPDRSYILAASVDPDDVLHVVGVWRMDRHDPTSMTRPWYARSSDAGETWETIDGTPLDVPLSYPATPDAAGILLNGDPPGHTNRVSTVGLIDGQLVISAEFGGDQMLLAWDGDQWATIPVPTDGFTYAGAAVDWNGHGDLRVVGRRGGQLRAYRPDAIPGPHIVLGAVANGTPDETEWRSTAVYHPFIEHGPGGPLISWMVPDGDHPRIRTTRTYQHQPQP